MKTTRQAAVAGLFYPADSLALSDTITSLLREAQSTALVSSNTSPKALIAPHAGYNYSGITAAKVYKHLEPLRDIISRVVVIGPSHSVSFDGFALTEADFFNTPLGQVAVNKADYTDLLATSGIQLLEQAHISEHSLEVQLPFLQQMLDHFSIIPIVTGSASPEFVAQILEQLWGGSETLIVVSSDLSHYHDYLTAQQFDEKTSEAILTLDFNAIQSENACGCVAINGLLCFAKKHPLDVSILDLRNSGDTSEHKDKVVGYGGYIFKEKNDA